jgi:hypothetical protein
MACAILFLERPVVDAINTRALDGADDADALVSSEGVKGLLMN